MLKHSNLCRYLQSSLGSKYLMALTGVMLFGFVFAHLSGNFLLYGGEEVFNEYAAGLKKLGPLLWVARLGLLGAFVVHVFTAIKLTRKNREARAVAYQCQNTVQATYASRAMPLTGIWVLFFILYHLSHFTWQLVHMPEGVDHSSLFQVVVASFQNPVVSILYILSMVVLGVHLMHGLASMFQSVGVNHPTFTPLFKCGAAVIATVVAIGFASLPISCMLGIIS